MEKKKIVSSGFSQSTKEVIVEKREFISMRKLIKPEYVERFNIDKLGIEDLAENIKQVGLINPIVVTPNDDKFEIVAGHRRYLALKMLGANKVSCVIVEDKNYNLEMIKLSENLLRVDLNVMEETEMLYRLKKLSKFSDVKLAKSIGKSEAYVRQRLGILKYPVELKDALLRNEVTFSVGRELIRIKNINVLKEYLKHAIKNGVTPAIMKTWVDDILKQEVFNGVDEREEVLDNQGLQVQTPKFVCFICGEETDFNSSMLFRIDHNCSKQLKSGG